MKINFECLTDHELADLITAAAQEWKLRQRQDHKTVVRRNPALQPKSVTIDEPPAEQKEFVLYVKNLAASDKLIRAHERRGVAEIAQQYPDWVKRQGLPTSGGTGPWNDLARTLKVGQAKEQ